MLFDCMRRPAQDATGKSNRHFWCYHATFKHAVATVNGYPHKNCHVDMDLSIEEGAMLELIPDPIKLQIWIVSYDTDKRSPAHLVAGDDRERRVHRARTAAYYGAQK